MRKINFFLSIILIATLARITIPPFIGHLPNFSANDAIALLSGAYFRRYFSAWVMTLLSVWVADVLLSKMLLGQWTLFYAGCFWQYGCYCFIALVGAVFLKNKINFSRLVIASLSASILFFIISNFGFWCSGLMYPSTLDGLISCYIAAIPFFKNTLMSDVFFSVGFWGLMTYKISFALTNSTPAACISAKAFSTSPLTKSTPRQASSIT